MSDINNYTSFLDMALETIELSGIDVSSYELDHFAWQCLTNEEYDLMKPKILEFSKEVLEDIVGGRRVDVFKLNNPIVYRHYKIIAIELIAPKEGKDRPSGWQHLEFVIDIPFEDLMSKYPKVNWNTESMNRGKYSHLVVDFENGITVKFHRDDIINTIKQNTKS